MQRRGLALAALALIALGVAGCTEDIGGGAACPSLCPQERVVLSDTTIDAVSLDTTLAAYPAAATEPYLPIVARGDTIDIRSVVRFDSLPRTWKHSASPTDSAITRVDSARIVARVVFPLRDSTAQFTIEAYDVDTAVAGLADTTAAAVLPLFRADRLIGSTVFRPSALPDSLLRIPIANEVVLRHVRDSTRLRVGLRVKAGERGWVSLVSREGGVTPALEFRVSPDTAQGKITRAANTATPKDPAFLTPRWADYLLIVKGQGTALPAQSVGVGGLPGRRGYLRFNIPSRILDSSTVVRATLLLTQRPNRAVPDQRDSVTVYAQAVLTSGVVSSLERAAEFIAEPGVFGLDSLRTVPADSGVKPLEIAGLLAQWRGAKVAEADRALVLRSPEEGTRPGGVFFYSIEAPAGVRPRLRLTYATRVPFGLP